MSVAIDPVSSAKQNRGAFAPSAGETGPSLRTVCAGVRQVTEEVLMLVGERTPERRDRRRATCHVRQIAMYVCHVALGMTMRDIGLAFGRDRTTVSHACAVVEDRRDDQAFDDFLSALERIASAAFAHAGRCRHD
ncbi:MAG: helix-turn-helix domain-containing protein [Allorhizobium sp.]